MKNEECASFAPETDQGVSGAKSASFQIALHNSYNTSLPSTTVQCYIEQKGGEAKMKKTLTAIVATGFAIAIGLAAAAPANAVSSHACNSGVAHAGHDTPAHGPGLTMIAAYCHG